MSYDASNPYGIAPSQNSFERQAGVVSPAYQSLIDANGNLKSSYSVDPTKSAAFNQMAQTAESSSLSPWAQMQMQQNTLATQTQRDQANAQSQGGTDQAMQHLMSTGGGTNSGAAAFLANQGSKNALMANQNIGAQSQQNALGIQGTDAQNKQAMLGQVASTETAAQSANAASAISDTSNANIFNSNRYNQQMAAWGAQQTANAQAAAANNSGKK